MACCFLWVNALVLALGLQAMPTPCQAQGFVEHLEPPVLQRGKTTRVTLIGAGLGKALDLWNTLPAGAIKATPIGDSTPSRAVFDVAVAGDAPVGITGARLSTIDGLANAFLFLIDDLPARPAPVSAMTPSKVALPAALWGRFREATVDRFAIDVAAGQTVSFEAVANRLGKDVDPLITIRDAKDKLVAERDNDPGLFFDCRFEHTFAAAGNYTVEVRDARFHGSEHGFYVLRMGRFPAARVAVPAAVRPGKIAPLRLPELPATVIGHAVPAGLAPGFFYATLRRPDDEGSVWVPLEATDADVTLHEGSGTTIEEATPARSPGILCGVLQKPGERHLFRLDLAKGQRLRVRAEARALNSPAELEIAFTDAEGKELRRAGENVQEEIVLDFSAPVTGVYGLRVSDVYRDGGPAFAYRLDVRAPVPHIQVSAEAEGITVPQGDYQPLPLTVTRTDYSGPITLKLLGAPPGVTLTPTEIDEGASAVVCKLAAAANTPVGLGTLQIIAQPVSTPFVQALVKGPLPLAPDLSPALARGAAMPPSHVKPAPMGPPTLATKGGPGRFLSPLAKGTAGTMAPTPVRARPLIDRQIVNVDLIPHALREDQRRPPVALTDRFALQVTPRSPFTFEVPEPLVTLGRYMHVEFPVAITRGPGFAGTIAFDAKGGQIAPKQEGRTRVYAEFQPGTPDRPQIKGSIHSKILTNTLKHRVDVIGVGTHDGRRVTLTRTFELDVRPAYTVAAEPAKLTLLPGAAAKVRLTADRLKPFDGDVTVHLVPSPGLTLPDQVVIPRGQSGIDIELKVAADRPPGRLTVNLNATAVVGSYEEEQRGRQLEIEIPKMPAPKK